VRAFFYLAPACSATKGGSQVRTIDTTSAEPLSWRPNNWLKAAGYPFSRPTLYQEIRAGRIDARKVGQNTTILTSPRQYLEGLPKTLGPPIGRARRKRGAAR
jgi:hypothetical protein